MNDREFTALRTLYLNGGAAIIAGAVAKSMARKDWVHIEVAEDDWAAQHSLVVPCRLRVYGAREYKKAVERRAKAGAVYTLKKGVTLDEVSSWEPTNYGWEHPVPLDLGDVPKTDTENKKPEEVEEEVIIEWEIEGLPAEVAEEGEG